MNARQYKRPGTPFKGVPGFCVECKYVYYCSSIRRNSAIYRWAGLSQLKSWIMSVC